MMLCVFIVMAVCVLTRCGDIETNPGPGCEHTTLHAQCFILCFLVCAVELNSGNLREVVNLTWPARLEWSSLGLGLGMDKTTLEVIRHDNHDKVKPCFKEMLSEWLKMVDPQPSWERLVIALQDPSVGCADLAKRIKKEFDMTSDSDKASAIASLSG